MASIEGTEQLLAKVFLKVPMHVYTVLHPHIVFTSQCSRISWCPALSFRVAL